ncbi:hypothetical protein FOA52_001406 [Chlamydomonas sp. UWO 241]|nr:hypothetical protein FOA52_001406 [Chlamydomonas sp. UWO 241]
MLVSTIGGLSPITRDFVNPERPWPHLSLLAEATAAAGFALLPRLSVYPAYVPLLGRGSGGGSGDGSSSCGGGGGSSSSGENTVSGASGGGGGDGSSRGGGSGEASVSSGGRGGASGAPPPPHTSVEWLDGSGGPDSIRAAVLRHADSSGYARASGWFAGAADGGGDQPAVAGGGGSEPAAAVAAAVAAAAAAAAAAAEPAAPAASSSVSSSSAGSSGSASSASSAASSAASSSGSGASAATTSAAAWALTAVARGGGRGGGWSVSRGEDGALAGLPRPARATARVLGLLREVEEYAARVAGAGMVAWSGLKPSGLAPTGPQAWAAESSVGGGDGAAALGRHPLGRGVVVELLSTVGEDYHAVVAAADKLRSSVCGEQVAYVVNRNINYTNVCTFGCSFCAFSKGRPGAGGSDEIAARGPAYLVTLDEISRRAAEAWDLGATEVCMQGGIHPDFTGDSYLRILAAAKAGAPGMHVHAFSPLEVSHGAASLGVPTRTFLAMLRDAGLGSLPGTAAEVLHPEVRNELCPDKLSREEWLEVIESAHSVGLPTTATLMFGHVEHGPHAWASHLIDLRDLQARTGGITEFVPLPFVHMAAPVYTRGRARRGPTLHECSLLHAVSRLALFPAITNIQASWVKMGPSHAARLLSVGCNDMGGVLMNESITRAAGAAHGQQLAPATMEALITAAGRPVAQRTTLYGQAPSGQVARSLDVARWGEGLGQLAFAGPRGSL